ADTHAVAGLKGLGAGSDRTSVLVVNIHAGSAKDRSRIEIIVQVFNGIVNLTSNLIHCIVQVNTIVNNKQQNGVVIVNIKVGRAGIQREDSIASRSIEAGVNLRIHVSSHFITYSIDNGRSSPACINELHLTTGQTTQEALSQSIVANVANLIVQAALQVIALAPINCFASDRG